MLCIVNKVDFETQDLASQVLTIHGLLEEITDRVVFVKTKVNFGRQIGEDNVLVIIAVISFLSSSLYQLFMVII